MNASTSPVFSFRINPLSKHPIIKASANRKRAVYQARSRSIELIAREIEL